MALQKQTASFPFAGGTLDLKTSAALVQPNRYLQLLNCSLVESSSGRQLQKRNGYLVFPMLDVNGAGVTGGTCLTTFSTNQSQELDYIGNGQLYTWSQTISRWIPKGPLVNITPSERSIAKGGYNKANCSSAIIGNVGLYAWEDAQGGVWYTVIDETSGSAFQNSTRISTTSSVPKVLAVNGGLHLLTADSGNINRYQFNVGTPAAAPVSSVLITATMGTTNPSFDATLVQAGGNLVCIAYVNNGGKLALALANAAAVWGISVTNTTTQNATWVNLCAVTGSIGVMIGLGLLGGMLYGFFNSATLVQLIGGFINETIANALTVPLATALQSTFLNTTMLVYFQIEPAGGNDRIIYIRQVDAIGGLGASALFKRGVALAGQAFNYGAQNYVPVVFVSAVQQTLFILQANSGSLPGVEVGKFYAQSAGPFPVSLTGSYGRLSSWTQTSTGVFSMATPTFLAIVSVNGKPTPINGITELTLDLTQFAVHGLQVGQNLHFCGPLGKLYDGQFVTEQNFNVYPEQPTLTQLGSNIGVITTQDGSADANPVAQPQIFSVIFPSIPGASGTQATQPADASLIVPGEYICFGGAINSDQGNATALGAGCAFYVWFSVGGVGSDPVFSTSTIFNGKGVQCALNTTDSASTIAQKFFNAVSFTGAAKTSALYTWVLTGNTVTGTAAAAGAFVANSYRTRPASNLKFVVNQMWDGTGAALQGYCAVSCCPGSLIQPGQYFTLTVTNAASTSDIPYYVWFQINGVGTDPAPTGYFAPPTPGAVNVLATDTEIQVAAKLRTQLATNFGALIAIPAAPTIPLVAIGNTHNVAASYSVLLYAQNPYNGGVGWGYLGASVNPGTTSTTATLGPVFSYQWSAIYEAVDNQGQLHRSTPSQPVTGYVPVYGQPPLYPGGPSQANVYGQGAFTVTTKTLRLTAKPNSDIAIYRTQGNGTVFQRTTSPVSLLFNITTQDTIAYTDYLSDLLLSGNELLYSQVFNGVVPNAPAPAAKFITSHQGRLIYCALENQQQLVYSQTIQPGYGIAFSGYYNPITIDPVWGQITAAASMDGNLIIFTLQNCWLVGGAGPDATNQGGFSTPQLITSAVGCRDPQSLVMTPEGLIFKSLKGIYMLDRKLNARYFGESLEALNADIITDATVTNISSVIRFGSATGTTLQFDFVQNQWATFSNHPVADATLWNNVYYYIRSTDGAVLQENPGSYLDGTTGFPMAWTSWWIKPSNLVQGECRMWAFYVKGYFTGTNPFLVQMAVDYNPNPVETRTLFPGAGSGGGGGSGVWGGDSVWGASSPWGSSSGGIAYPDMLQFRYQPGSGYALAEAYQLSITEQAPYNATLSWGLDALDIEFGVQPGTGRRLPQGANI